MKPQQRIYRSATTDGNRWAATATAPVTSSSARRPSAARHGCTDHTSLAAVA